MNSYIFMTTEGWTFQPGTEAVEPDIENCQVIGFAQGENEKQALENLVKENQYLLETTFDELICIELKQPDYFKHKAYFHLSDCRTSSGSSTS
jgi:hypothetical protein